MRKVSHIILFAILLVSAACTDPNNVADVDVFRERKDICVVVGRKVMIDFESGNIQTSFNEAKHLYRAGRPVVQLDSTSGKMVETVEEYFVLSLQTVPGEAGATMAGSLHLKAASLSSGFRTYTVNLEVLKKEGSLAWFWDPSQKVGVIARISE